MIYPVSPNAVDVVWPHVLPYVEKSIAKGFLPVDPLQIKEAIRQDRFKLFLLNDGKKLLGVSILNIRNELGIKYLNVYLMSYDVGYPYEVEDMEALYTFARKLDIKYITYMGRPGFQKKHKKFGWKAAQVLMVKEL